MASLRNFSIVSALLFVVPVGALAVGCTVENDDPPDPGPQYTYPAEADFCAAIATAECTDAVVDACYASAPEKLAEDRAKCVGLRKESTRCNPSSFAYFPQFADACVASRQKIYADAELTKTEIEDDYEACLPVFSRGGGKGSVCTTDIDCDTAAELRCVVKGTPAAGSCQKPIEAAGGDECTAADTLCEDTHYCDGSNCLTRKAAGAACSDAILCGEDLKCEALVCEEKLGGGETCTADVDCQGFCILTAGEITGTCAGKIVLAISSQTCDPFQP